MPPTDAGVSLFFREGPIELGSSRSELEARLGGPDSVHAHTVSNRHDPTVTDSVLTLYYAGLVAEIHRAGYDGKEILASVVISDGRFLQPGAPVRPGQDSDAVRAALGEPDESDADMMLYVCDECLVAGQETVRFIMERDTVRRVEVRYWVD
ncbi:MAG TPA: hypothetical protein VK936_10835 [Longimicrobiales bacterium]|nr:hypothetical protein [Longimicrobiales bacterium]